MHTHIAISEQGDCVLTLLSVLHLQILDDTSQPGLPLGTGRPLKTHQIIEKDIEGHGEERGETGMSGWRVLVNPLQ